MLAHGSNLVKCEKRPGPPAANPGPVRPKLDKPQAAPAARRVLRVLYTFAGPKRKADLRKWLEIKCGQAGVDLDMAEVDILRTRSQDLMVSHHREQLRADVRGGQYDAAVTTPPCDTTTRVQWANNDGPRPVRSADRLDGFPG